MSKISATALNFADWLKERAKDCCVIRMWTSPQRKDDPLFSKTINIYVVQTFMPTISENPIAKGFEPFTKETTFVCEAKFTTGRKIFFFDASLWQINDLESRLATITNKDCEEICKIPELLKDITNSFLFINEHGALCAKGCRTAQMALALLERELRHCPTEEKGSQTAFARWMMCETLNRLNADNWQSSESLAR